jgi:hypothetical protein
MNNADKHVEALKYLLSHVQPSAGDIDAMTPAQLDDFLSDYHVDVKHLESLIPEWQKMASGRLALERARQERLAQKKQESADLGVIPRLRDELLAGLIAHFGAIENIPMAARNLESIDDAELRQLYIDAVLRTPPPRTKHEGPQPDPGGA